MPFSSGTFSRIYNWVNEQLSSPIEIDKLDAQEEDFATALNNCILRDGTGLPTAAMDWNGQNLTNVAAFTATGIVTGGRFVPTSSSVPTNGMYLSAANTLAFSSNTTLRWSVNSTGTHTLAAPSSGTTLVVPGLTGTAAAYIGVLGSTNNPRVEITGTEASALAQIDFTGSTGSAAGRISRAGTAVIDISSARNVSIAAPSSGTHTVSGASGAVTLNLSETTVPKLSFTTSGGERLYMQYTEGTAIARIDSDATLELASNNAARISLGTSGNITIAAPSSGTTLGITAVSSGVATSWTDGTVTAAMSFSSSIGTIGTSSNHAFRLITNSLERLSVSAGGAVTINTPTSGVGLTIAGGGLTVTAGGITVTAGAITGDGSGLTTLSATQLTSGTVPDARFPATLPALSGVNLTALNASNLASGTVNTARISGSYTGITALGNATVQDSAGNALSIGYRGMPQSTNTSIVAADAGKHIFLSGTTNTVTIPANASVAFEVGTTIVLVNDGSGNTTLNITTDTLEWFQGGTSSTGSRTIATKSIVTIVKIASTRWALSGAGIS